MQFNVRCSQFPALSMSNLGGARTGGEDNTTNAWTESVECRMLSRSIVMLSIADSIRHYTYLPKQKRHPPNATRIPCLEIHTEFLVVSLDGYVKFLIFVSDDQMFAKIVWLWKICVFVD